MKSLFFEMVPTTVRELMGTGGEARNFVKSQSLYEERSEFFQAPGPLYRGKGIVSRVLYQFLFTCQKITLKRICEKYEEIYGKYF